MSAVDRNEAEREELETALGAGGTGKGAAGSCAGRPGAEGSGEAAEVAGHPGPARRARPGAGRPGRFLPGRAAGSFGRVGNPADPRGRGRASGRAGRGGETGRPAAAASRRCSPAGRRSTENVKPKIAVEAMVAALAAPPLRSLETPAHPTCAFFVVSRRRDDASLCAERHAALAQSVERFTRNEKVASSILAGGSNITINTAKPLRWTRQNRAQSLLP